MSSDPTPGELFAGRYLIERLLGRGGFGGVYRAHDQSLDESVALKVLEARGAQDVERFRREVKLARRITHPNVARTYDIGEADGVLFLTMELLDGQSLRAMLRERNKLPQSEALSLAASICDGLAAAHQAGVVHRDLKPENVFLETSGRVVLLDFGVARSFVEPGMNSMAVGTPAFMAPEQLANVALDGRTDLYALGIILHELIAGVRPTWGPRNERDLFVRMDVERANVQLPDAPTELEGLVRRMLARDPEARPGSAREAAALLRSVGSDMATADITNPRSTSPAPRAETTFGPVPKFGRLVGVIPFKTRGETDGDLGEILAEELVDVLSRVRGLRVLSSRATARFGADGDPIAIGKELGADIMIEGTIHRRGESIRVTTRMLEVSSALQLYDHRYEEHFHQILAFEETLAQHIAEALRLELALSGERGHATAESMELYLTGRRKLRALQLWGAENALELFERASQSSPDFRPAVASLALAKVRHSYASAGTNPEDTRAVTANVVRHALEIAGDFPESHVAAAVFCSQYGDLVQAVRHLRTAVTIAPTSSQAQESLGILQCEAGRSDEGVRRLEAAMALDPLVMIGTATLARHHFLLGDTDRFQSVFDELEKRTNAQGRVYWQLKLRTLAWQRKLDELQVALAQVKRDERLGRDTLVAYAEVVSGKPLDLSADPIGQSFPTHVTPRFEAFLNQLSAEAFSLRGDADRAFRHLERAFDLGLSDVAWLEYCPALAPLSARPGVAEMLDRVRDRTVAIWAE